MGHLRFDVSSLVLEAVTTILDQCTRAEKLIIINMKESLLSSSAASCSRPHVNLSKPLEEVALTA